MSVQLILKNSAIQDKEATAAQLAVGEIALNYYESGPFLQCKDTAGNVWRLGGVVIAATAPSTPSKGAWWLDSDDNSLYFYNGSTWLDVKIGEITNADIAANAEIAVSKLADGAARQILQTDAAGTGVEWTNNIDVPGTLDVTGVATFDNNVVITGNLTVNGTTTTIDTQTLIVEDKNIEMGAVTTPTDTTADGGGITLKGTTDKTINWINATDAWTSSERFSVPLGSNSAPSLTFTGDPNTGIYSPGADQVAISTGGSGRLFIDASGRVGIGGTSDFAEFQIAGSAPSLYLKPSADTETSEIAFRNAANSQTRGFISYYHSDDSLRFRVNLSERMRLDSSGRLGLGTSAPAVAFEIAAATPAVRVSLASDSTKYGTFYNSAGTTAIIARNGASNGSIIFQRSDGTTTTTSATIDSSGNVGIGTSSPDTNLEIALSGSSANGLLLSSDNADTSARLFFQNATAGEGYAILQENGGLDFRSGATAGTSSGTQRVRIDSSGRVGIGTTSPNESLHITSGALRVASNSPAIAASDGALLDWVSASGEMRLSAARTGANSSKIAFITYNSGSLVQAVNIDSSGRVGIGTTSPTRSLQVYDSSNAIISAKAGSAEGFINTTSTAVNFESSSGIPLTFSPAGSLKATLDTSGRLLVGTSSTAADTRLFLNGNSSGSATPAIAWFTRDQDVGSITGANFGIGYLRFGTRDGGLGAQINVESDAQWGNGDYPGRLVFSTTADGASSPTERMRISSAGDVGIGNSGSATVRLTVYGVDSTSSNYAMAIRSSAGANLFYLRNDGHFFADSIYNQTTAAGANVYIDGAARLLRSTSSLKYKTNVETLDDNYADAILNVRPVWYQSLGANDNPNWGWWGFIAEEVAEIDPRLVSWKTTKVVEDENGSPLEQPLETPEPEGVYYDRFVPHLLNLIKRQKEQIEAMEARLSALEAS